VAPGSRGNPIPFAGGAAIFQRMFARLGCHGRPPHFDVVFYPYASLSHTIRLRDERAEARLSDLLRGAPLEVQEAAAAILLAKMYRMRLPRPLAETYRRFAESAGVHRRMDRLRRRRGRRTHTGAQGRAHDLRGLFDRLNAEYFSGLLPATDIGWSKQTWKRQLGVFDPGLQHIVINRRLDHRQVPEHVVGYVVYHEMLHLERALPRMQRDTHRGSAGILPAVSSLLGSTAQPNRCHLGLHTPEFRRAEKRFREYGRARRFLLRAGLW
jgi:hypothetical protein